MSLNRLAGIGFSLLTACAPHHYEAPTLPSDDVAQLLDQIRSLVRTLKDGNRGEPVEITIKVNGEAGSTESFDFSRLIDPISSEFVWGNIMFSDEPGCNISLSHGFVTEYKSKAISGSTERLLPDIEVNLAFSPEDTGTTVRFSMKNGDGDSIGSISCARDDLGVEDCGYWRYSGASSQDVSPREVRHVYDVLDEACTDIRELLPR